MKEKRTAFVAIFLSTLFALSVLAGEASVVYRGNVDTKVFHQASCRYFNCKSCTATFDARQAAVDAGYRPCKMCKP